MASSMNVVCLIISLFLFVTVSFADDDHGADAVSYDRDSFDNAIANKKHFVMFFAPWCGHCKRLAPAWSELAKVYNHEESPVVIAKVDCTLETALCSDHEVTGYPTLKFFHQKTDDFQRYKGNRDLDSLKKFVDEQVNKPESTEDSPTLSQEKEAVVELTGKTFSEFTEKGLHFVKFYAPWCGHCKRLAPTWEELARSFADSEHVSISKVNCDESSDLCANYDVRGYPTLMIFNDGDKLENYEGGRSHEDLQAFVTKKIGETTGTDDGTIPDQGGEQDVADLTDDSFSEAIAHGLTFVKFFAPWCGHCKRLAPTWEDLGAATKEKDVVIARVDCTQHRATCDQQSVKGYPTLVIFQNGVRLDDYRGERSLEALQKFVDGFLGHTEL